MSLASEFINSGIVKSTGTPCACGGAGVSPVGLAGMVHLGPGEWACTCEAGRRALAARVLAAGREQAGIPRKFAALDLETFKAAVSKSVEKTKAHRLACEWATSQARRPWLFLHGRTGRGKTGLGIGALKALMAQGQVGRFTSSMDMLEEVKARFGGDSEAYLEALCTVDVLMLDEVVPPYPTDWTRGVLFTVLWRRDAAGPLTTILTTAATPDETRAALTEAGMRRIEENALMLRLDGNEIVSGK